MRVLCIRSGPPYSGVRRGQVYESFEEYKCSCPRQKATIIRLNHKTKYGDECLFCGAPVPCCPGWWAPKRDFIPLGPDGLVTEKEVRELYMPTPRHELTAG